MRVLLAAEEAAALFIEKAKPGATLKVEIRHGLAGRKLVISAPGEQADPFPDSGMEADLSNMEDEDALQAIRAILLRAQEERIRFSCAGGVNRVRISLALTKRPALFYTVTALLAGLVFGIILKWGLPGIGEAVDTYLLDPFTTVFMNALRMIIGPVVFFSIVSCITQFKNLRELGRIGAKVMGMYLLTTVIAILPALGISAVIRPGEWGFALAMTNAEAVAVDTDVDTSLLTTLVNIVSGNILSPFLHADTMQIMFIAVLCGIAISRIGESAAVLADFFEACNTLFLTITSLVTQFIPAAVFCSMASMILTMQTESFLAVLGMGLLFIFTCACMIGICCLLILVMGSLNPLTFLKKSREGMLTSFTLSSSAAAIPVNMKTCTEKLGISSRICSFSIPLGAIVNMDGACIFMVICGLFLARAYGVTVLSSGLVSLMITIILLSLASPGVPGAGLVCTGIVVATIGVPIVGIGLDMGIYPFLDMFSTASNTTGDVMAALVVAKNEGLLDEEFFNG
ncbi:MAG: dicarboxylate/amino acid:cation symporter [Solobacterium sp.]|nr:dicarboxylate/amino acid:cation symporter [Solobacterium sp.]